MLRLRREDFNAQTSCFHFFFFVLLVGDAGVMFSIPVALRLFSELSYFLLTAGIHFTVQHNSSHLCPY